MLTEQIPNDLLVEWSKSFINNPYDRPWFSAKLNKLANSQSSGQYPCRCSQKVILKRYNCEDGGWVFLGQCAKCETIIWAYVDKA